MDEYREILQEFDNSYKSFLECIDEKMYSDAGIIQGYLVGMIKTLQMLLTPETDISLVAEIKKRVELIS